MKFFFLSLFLGFFCSSIFGQSDYFFPKKAAPKTEVATEEEVSSLKRERIHPRNLFVTGGLAQNAAENFVGAFARVSSRFSGRVRAYAEFSRFFPKKESYHYQSVTSSQNWYGIGINYGFICHEKYVVYGLLGGAHLRQKNSIRRFNTRPNLEPSDQLDYKEPVTYLKTSDFTVVAGVGGQYNIKERFAVQMEWKLGLEVHATAGLTYFLIN